MDHFCFQTRCYKILIIFGRQCNEYRSRFSWIIPVFPVRKRFGPNGPGTDRRSGAATAGSRSATPADAQSNATHLEEKRVVELVKSNYPRFQVARFSSESVSRSPVVLIGTFTAVNNAGVAGGARDAYRICLALADLKTKTIICARAAGRYRSHPGGLLCG